MMKSRVIWRRAHPVRLPNRDTAPHREMMDAFYRDIEARLLVNFEDRLLQSEMAREIERADLVEEARA